MFRYCYVPLALVTACLLCGCGSTKSRSATEQLLVSDAVDRSIARIDFSPLSGSTVYLDTQYLKTVKGTGFVNADYIISSLRQQMLAANCYLEEDRDSATYIAEVRVGALGSDAHDVTYGIPPSSGISNAASLVPNAPPIPMIPEVALAKRADEAAAAKIAVFAYDRETHEPFWQSGISQARSTSKDMWLFGAGPFQSGTIHEGIQLAGDDLEIPLLGGDTEEDHVRRYEQYSNKKKFRRPPNLNSDLEQPPNAVQPASHSEEAVPLETPPESTPPPVAPPAATPPAATPPAATPPAAPVVPPPAAEATPPETEATPPAAE